VRTQSGGVMRISDVQVGDVLLGVNNGKVIALHCAFSLLMFLA
jgi:hypothetical protein